MKRHVKLSLNVVVKQFSIVVASAISLIKHINKIESECASLSKQQLASSHDCNKAQEALDQLHTESQWEQQELLAELSELRHAISAEKYCIQ